MEKQNEKEKSWLVKHWRAIAIVVIAAIAVAILFTHWSCTGAVVNSTALDSCGFIW